MPGTGNTHLDVSWGVASPGSAGKGVLGSDLAFFKDCTPRPTLEERGAGRLNSRREEQDGTTGTVLQKGGDTEARSAHTTTASFTAGG